MKLRHLSFPAAFLGAYLALLVPGTAALAQVVGIAAVVNDEIVSAWDVKVRQDIVMSSAGIKPSAEARRRNRAQVLRALINEKLQMQEASRLNITVSSADIEKAKRRIEQQNKLPVGSFSKFMRQRGIPVSGIVAQMRSEIAWSKVLQRRVHSQIQISDEEVKEVIAQFARSEGLRERRIAEIFIPVDAPSQDADAARTALRLIEQMKKGAPFNAIARQFSQSNSAKNGGAIGWILEGQLAPELEVALSKITPGKLTEPIRTVEGYYILLLREVRRVGMADPMAAKVILKQVALPLQKNATSEQATGILTRARHYAAALNNCDDIDRIAKEDNLPGSGSLGTLRVGDLPPKFRGVVSKLQIGQPSSPLRTDQGFHVLMVCEREDAPVYRPDEKAIAQSLAEQRLSMMARRYLRDLRRTAVIDLR